jgi:hypothetical protein
MASGLDDDSAKTSICALETGADDESTTLTVRSEARAMVDKRERATTARSRERKRMTASFTRERG